MIVEFKDESSDDFTRNSFEITINGARRLFVFDDYGSGDNTLAGSFNDVYNIETIIKMAHAAGKAGEQLEIITHHSA